MALDVHGTVSRQTITRGERDNACARDWRAREPNPCVILQYVYIISIYSDCDSRVYYYTCIYTVYSKHVQSERAYVWEREIDRYGEQPTLFLSAADDPSSTTHTHTQTLHKTASDNMCQWCGKLNNSENVRAKGGKSTGTP